MCKVRNVKMCVLCLLSVINCFGLYLMSACSVHIHIHRNKAVLLLFCLCFLVSLSFHFHLSAASACCATSIPRNNTAYPFHAFLYSSLLLSLLLSTLMNMVAAGLRWFLYVILWYIYYLGLGLHHFFFSFFSKLPFLLFCFFFLLFGLVVLLKGFFSAAQILASWTSSASLVFHSLLMRMLSFQLKVLDLAFWFVQPHGFQCWGFSSICLRFGVTWILPY